MIHYAARVCFLLVTLLPVQGQTASRPAAQPSAPAGAAGQQANMDPAKEADIRRLLELTGTKAVMNQMMDSMRQNIKPLMTNSLPPGEYREKLVNLFFAKFQAKADLKELLDKAVPVYDKYFSHDEIKGLLAFYQTPLGQKTISVLPKVTAEMTQAGQQWGEEMGRQCMQDVLAEHPDLAAALDASEKASQ